MAADGVATRIGIVKLPRCKGAVGTDGSYPRNVVQEARPPHAGDTEHVKHFAGP